MYHFVLVNFHHPLVVNLETMLFLEGLALKHFSSVGLLTFPSNIIWSVWGKVALTLMDGGGGSSRPAPIQCSHAQPW